MSYQEPVLCSVGDIGVTQHWVITPNGTFPLRRTTWVSGNNTVTTSGIPTWAIVMCILTIWLCLLGLLFLLAKEQSTTGTVQVSVQGEGTYHVTQVPVSHWNGINQVEQRVHYIRGLVAQLG